MADVIKVGEVTHTIFDIDDILDIVRCECGSDVYAWLQNYIDEKDLEIKQAKQDYKELEEYIDEKLVEFDSLQKSYNHLP